MYARLVTTDEGRVESGRDGEFPLLVLEKQHINMEDHSEDRQGFGPKNNLERKNHREC